MSPISGSQPGAGIHGGAGTLAPKQFQNSSSAAARRPGAFPAISAPFTAPMETPHTQSGSSPGLR
jgi:hypothetical protein